MSEASLPINGPKSVSDVAESLMLQHLATDYPHPLDFTTGHVLAPGYDFGGEFDDGLDVALSGLSSRLSPR